MHFEISYTPFENYIEKTLPYILDSYNKPKSKSKTIHDSELVFDTNINW